MRKQIAGWAFVPLAILAPWAVDKAWADAPPWVGQATLVVLAIIAVALLAWAYWPKANLGADPSKPEVPRKLKADEWPKIDRRARFRLGQWAAIIEGYDTLADWKDDAAYRPWKHEFFFLKGEIEEGRFKPRTLKGVPHCDVETIVYRDEITKFYEDSGRRVPALFPDERGKRFKKNA